MFTRKRFSGFALFTLSVFICFTLTYEYSLAQEEHPLLKAQRLYKQGNFIEAIKVLEVFIEKIKGNQSKNKQLAEANLMLARIYYEAGEDARVAEYMKQAVEAYAEIGKEEGNLDFKTRLELVRREWLKSQAGKAEAAPVLTTETTKTDISQPSVQEKEKPAPQLKKKKKFRWLGKILVLCIIAGAAYGIAMLVKGKKKILTVTFGESVDGYPGSGSHTYQKDDKVSYSYFSPRGYHDLLVELDGKKVSASGNFTMDSNHTLSVSATKIEATFLNGVLMVEGVRYKFASIPAGTFQMGSNNGESDEKPVHTVRISKTFWLGKTEVTQGLWQAVMGSNPSYFKKGDSYPVEQISWYEIQSFIRRLNLILGGNAFRLPTEAEWEYACRAGTTGDHYGNLDAIAWYYSGNTTYTTHPVGQKQANAWGLYDTLGNVEEWCQDYYGPYSAEYQVDPTGGPASGVGRVSRGGCFSSDAYGVRSSIRWFAGPDYPHYYLGFRLARTNE